MVKQLELFPELDTNSNEPVIHDPASNTFTNAFKPKQPTETEIAEKQIVKVARQPDSRGVFKAAVKADEKKYQDSLKPKPRVETGPERIERLLYIYDDIGPKPKHYDDPNIIDYENYKQPPREFSNSDPSSFPSDRDQKQRLNAWDLMVADAKTPAEKKEIRDVLRRDYKNTKGKNMSSKELRMINKHPDQLKQIIAPVVTPTPTPYVAAPVAPQIPIEEVIKQRADLKLQLQQQDHDLQYGKGGLAHLMRPKK